MLAVKGRREADLGEPAKERVAQIKSLLNGVGCKVKLRCSSSLRPGSGVR